MTSPPQEKSNNKIAIQATHKVVRAVSAVRGKTTGPLLFVSRLIVYSFCICVASMAAIILFTIASVKILNQLLPGDVWAAYLLIGAVFAFAGTFLWSKRVT
jgi:hypothetical protein